MMNRVIAAAACILLLAAIPGIAGQNTNVLIIESYHGEFPWDASYIQGIKEGMTGEVSFHTFEMNTKRIPKSDYEQSAEAAWACYLRIKPALVFLGDDNALKYLGPKFTGTDTPVVFLGINNNPRTYNVLGKGNITGVLERPLLKRSIVEIKKIIGLSKVLVLFDTGNTSRVIRDEVFNGKEHITLGNINIHLRLIDQWETWQAAVTEARRKGYDALMIGLYHTLRNKNGTHIPAPEVLGWTSQKTPVPPFAFWDFSVGRDKAIGGLILFGKPQGLAAARMGMKILKGTPPSRIRVETGKTGKLMFSQSQLEIHDIRLPPEMAATADFVE